MEADTNIGQNNDDEDNEKIDPEDLKRLKEELDLRSENLLLIASSMEERERDLEERSEKLK